ncbi:MAG: cardiolipin synthase, partial [Flavobacteriaceae bacterium]|nr:cardiolipin synthase [Flavobacteriaceae bacterium]
MDWFTILKYAYWFSVGIICLRIIWDTRSNTKTLAYVLVAIFVPVVGIIGYFVFGVNYRKRKIYNEKLFKNKELRKELQKQIKKHSGEILDDAKNPDQEALDNGLDENVRLIHFLLKETLSPVTDGNEVELLLNGETKFPKVFEAIKQAKQHIHIEYYIYANDTIGHELSDLLIEKAKEGVKVKFIYDDFGSKSIRKKEVDRLKDAGVEAYPFYEIKLIAFANRINYRNHRKIIVVDGSTAFVGGINVSDDYINEPEKYNGKNSRYWRDTHLMIKGPAVAYLQYTFITDWNFCCESQLVPNEEFFPKIKPIPKAKGKIVQIAASGPDSDLPNIGYSLMQAINLAEKEILITTPYFIPGESLMDNILIAANSGVKVKLLVPEKSDSVIVDSAARSYYSLLLEEGVEIYLYQKGFIHAKTMVTDNNLS